MFNLLRRGWNYFKTRVNTFQNALTLLGCILGFSLALILIITGVAAIPFTGGSSLLPTWLGAALFILLLTGTFSSAGKYIGISIDTIVSKEKASNEKIATIAGCVIGLTISILAVPLHFLGIACIGHQSGVATWEILLPFIPLTMGAFGSACSYIGRGIDALTNGKTIFDLFRRQPKPPLLIDKAENIEQEKEKTEARGVLKDNPTPRQVNDKKIHLANRMYPPRTKLIRQSTSMPDLFLSRSKNDVEADEYDLPRVSGLSKVPRFLHFFMYSNLNSEKEERKILNQPQVRRYNKLT